MSRRDQQTRLRLIVTANIEAPRQRRKSQKPRKPNPRTVLLRTLREQRQKVAGWPHFERTDAPELYDLAIAADNIREGRRTFNFRGVQFRLKFGFRRYVCDPKTGAFLIGGRFLA
jgi:hypothetical protein